MEMCFVPEAFAFIGTSPQQSKENAEPLSGNFIKTLKNLAKEQNLWLSLGGFSEKTETSKKLSNTHIIINSNGDIVSTYRKMHMYDVDVNAQTKIRESDNYEPGNQIADIVQSPCGNLGLTICYDLRFPEVYRILTSKGAEILLVPSAFFKTTGEAHWEILLRSRAIENQCFVIAAAQQGKHSEKRESYGHSIVIDPWGKVLLDMDQKLGIECVEIDLNQVYNIRQKLPSLSHTRKDLYEVIDKTQTKK